MTREDAEALRRDPRHWHLGILYSCRQDPRVVVRNRWFFGWTWNWSHPMVLPAIVAAVLLVLVPSLYVTTRVTPLAGFGTAMGTVAVVVLLGYRSATGPRA
ncbi:MAG: hypothetical protein OER90_08665 [Gemmatimonadota bacterium]|nr:hypothetical protein [Gemmatimonadota bacterium]